MFAAVEVIDMSAKLEVYDSALVPEPFGLYNTGVICHFNALLQALVGCSSVVRAALRHRGYLARTRTGRAFHDFFWAAAPGGRPPGSDPFEAGVEQGFRSARLLAALVADLRARRPTFHYGPSQESASEGLVLLLDMLDAPARRGSPPEENPIARLFYHRYVATVYCLECRAAVSEELDVAVQFNLFHFDSLPRPPATPEEFGDLIRGHVSPLEGYLCERCGARGRGIRRYRLRMVPEVLVCLFNLYGGAGRAPRGGAAAPCRHTRGTASSIRCSTSSRSSGAAARGAGRYFPARFPLPGAGGGALWYRWIAQIEHGGSLLGGHYVTAALRAGGRPFRFDDDAFVPTDRAGPAPNVYIVLYHADAHPPPPSGSKKLLALPPS